MKNPYYWKFGPFFCYSKVSLFGIRFWVGQRILMWRFDINATKTALRFDTSISWAKAKPVNVLEALEEARDTMQKAAAGIRLRNPPKGLPESEEAST